jgi:hypothetical protein
MEAIPTMKKYITAYLPDEVYDRVQETVKYYHHDSISSLVESMFRSYQNAMPTPTQNLPTPISVPTGGE